MIGGKNKVVDTFDYIHALLVACFVQHFNLQSFHYLRILVISIMTEWSEKSAKATFLINKVKLLLKFKSHTHNDKHQSEPFHSACIYVMYLYLRCQIYRMQNVLILIYMHLQIFEREKCYCKQNNSPLL